MHGIQRTKQFLVAFLVLGLIVLNTGCKKDSTSDPAGGGTSAPSVPAPPTLKGPSTSSTDVHATQTKSHVTTANAYMTQFAAMSAVSSMPGTSAGTDTWTWTVTVGGATYTWTATKNANGSFTWTATINGTSGGVTYNNWVAYEGTIAADGKTGDWHFHDLNTTVMSAKFTYSTAADGTITATVLAYSSGNLTYRADVTNKTDNSGEVDVYGGTTTNVLVFKAVWTGTGSGTWWTYDSTTGLQTATGTWS